MDSCIFCNIPKTDPAKLLFKDKIGYVINDKHPVTKGHVLIIPLRHYKNIIDAPETVVSHLFSIARKFAKKAIKSGATGINIVTNSGRDANQQVMHFHIHIIPRYPGKKASKPHYKVAGAVE